jgi:hypothetical protein
MPDPTINISQPPAGATVPPAFPANGQVDPASASVSGDMWNRNTNNHYPPTTVRVQPDGSWTMLFRDIPPDNPYSLRVWITNTAVLDQHDGITVQ